jgi:hypothetical protein
VLVAGKSAHKGDDVSSAASCSRPNVTQDLTEGLKQLNSSAIGNSKNMVCCVFSGSALPIEWECSIL